MAETTNANSLKMNSSRANASPALLQRKALERAKAHTTADDTIEDSFPAASCQNLASNVAAELPKHAPEVAMPVWSSEDESQFRELSGRRKAAGYRVGKTRDRGEFLTLGDIKPNPNTVVAVIVALVAARGIIGRPDLVAAMAGGKFPNKKAQPQDKGWCQGYIAGALRNGFLKAANQPQNTQAALGEA